MSSESYFVITSSEDGVSIEEYGTKQAFLDSFILGGEDNPDYDSDEDCNKAFVDIGDFLDHLPEELMNPRQMPEGAMIVIKGKIVVPKETKTVTKAKVE